MLQVSEIAINPIRITYRAMSATYCVGRPVFRLRSVMHGQAITDRKVIK